MDINIKKTSDATTALKIAKNSKDYFETGFEDLKRDLKKHSLYGAYLGDKMVGFITFKKNGPDVIEISWLAVNPPHRKQGIGSKLVNDSLNKIGGKYKICEVKALAETHPDKGYAKTRKFYKRLGFIPLEIIQPYPGWDNNNPCQIFVKPIK